MSILNKIDEWATLVEQKSEKALQKAQARKLAYELEEAKHKLPPELRKLLRESEEQK